jgi:heme/copper-type cytochrome/quinol oxidase subunit 1
VRTGRSLLALSAVGMVLGVIEALALRAQLAHADATLIPPGFHYQLLTLHGASTVFLGLLPASMGLFLLLAPGRIGDGRSALPRCSSWGARLMWAGAIVLHAGLGFGGTSGAGMLGNASMTSLEWAPREALVRGPFTLHASGVDGWALAMLLVAIGATCVALDVVATVLGRRRPGLALAATPPFAINSLLAGLLGLFAFPALALACATLLADRFLGTAFHVLDAGADPTLWPRLTALLGHPQVVMLLLPALGLGTELVVAASGRPLHGAAAVRLTGLVLFLAAVLAWLAQLTPSGSAAARAALPLAGSLLALATNIGVAHSLATLWRRPGPPAAGAPLTPALLFVLGMLAMLVLGAWSMLPLALQPASARQIGTLYTVAHAHEMLFGGATFGLIAALYQHWPAIAGRTIDVRLGNWSFALTLIGAVVAFVPMHVLGLAGMPRRIHTYPAAMGWEGWNAIASVGALIVALGAIVFAMALVRARAIGQDPA